MVRDALFAFFLGTSGAWDAFVIAFAIPNMFRHLFGEGALTSAFVPVLVQKIEREGKTGAEVLIRSVVGWMLLVLGGLVLLAAIGTLAAEHGLTLEPDVVLILRTLRVTLPYALLICLTAVLGAALNGLRHFAMPALAPLLLNVVLCASAFATDLAGSDKEKLKIVALAVLIGGVVQLAAQLPPLTRRGFIPWPRWSWGGTGLGEVITTFAPAVAGLAVIQVNEMLDNVIAKMFVEGDGAASALYYGNRLQQLPLALIGFSIATVAFPTLASHAVRGERTEFGEALRRALGFVFFIALPAAVGLGVLSEEITRVIFQRGRFDAESTVRTAWVVRAYAVGIPFYAANMVLTRAFYSVRDIKTPVRISLTTVGLNLILNLSLVYVLAERGIAAATSATGLVNFVLLLREVRRHVDGVLRGWVADTAWALVLGASMGAGLVLLRWVWPMPGGQAVSWLWVAGAVLLPAALYVVAGFLLGVRPAREVAKLTSRSR